MKVSIFVMAALLLGTRVGYSQEAAWTSDYAKAVAQAKTENKAVLLDFTGSDWCGWCMKMKKETLDTPQFNEYAQKNLVLVTVDFPHKTPLTPAVKAQNEKLNAQYHADGFPTYVLTDKFGRELGRQTGYLEGGPAAFIAKFSRFYTPPKPPTASNADSFDSFFKKASPTPAAVQ